MVCQQLDELEWDFIQAREESPDLDSLGWTDREFSCLDAILEHKHTSVKGIKANAAFGTKFPPSGAACGDLLLSQGLGERRPRVPAAFCRSFSEMRSRINTTLVRTMILDLLECCRPDLIDVVPRYRFLASPLERWRYHG